MAFNPFKKKAVEGSATEEAGESAPFEKKEDATPKLKIGKGDVKDAAKAVKKMSKADKFATIAKAQSLKK